MEKYCAKCGEKLQEGEKFCTKCGAQKEETKETVEKSQKKKLPKPVKIILIILGVIILISLLTGEDQESQNKEEKEQSTTTEESTIKEPTIEEEIEEEPKISKEDYMKSCQEISYEKLARYPDKYKGTKVKLTGEVIQVIESSWTDSINLRVNVTQDEYGYWDDTVLVDYTYKTEGVKILEDDIITIYGTSDGEYTYTSTIGASVTLPYIKGKYIEIN